MLLSSLCIISQAKLTHPGKIVHNVVWCWEQSKSYQMMGLRHSWIFLIAVEKVKVGSSVCKFIKAEGEVDDSAPDGRSHSDPDTLYMLPIGSSNTQWRTLSDRLLMETVTWSEQWAAHMAPFSLPHTQQSNTATNTITHWLVPDGLFTQTHNYSRSGQMRGLSYHSLALPGTSITDFLPLLLLFVRLQYFSSGLYSTMVIGHLLYTT